MGSENNMVAVQQCDREAAKQYYGYDDEKGLAYWGNASAHRDVERLATAFARHRLAQPDAQQGASSPASGEGAGCANCGGRDFPSVIAGDDGEAFCSVACLDQHEELGCPLESGDQYRTPAQGLDAATIERCAQVANEKNAHPEFNMACWDIAAAIRALNTASTTARGEDAS